MSTPTQIHIQKRAEYSVGRTTHQKIAALFVKCFGGYPRDQSYYRQLPSFRFLAWEDGTLVGQMGVDYRLVSLDGQTVRIFGIVDICVDPDHQSRRIASSMLAELEKVARRTGVDFLLLFASSHELYTKNKFRVVKNKCRWMLVTNNESIGIVQRSLEDSILVKPTGNIKWDNDAVLDLLGTAF
jgi:predicted N-acetyltransferase YhbS